MSSFSLSSAKSVAVREDAGTDVALRDELGEPLTVLVNGEAVPAVARVAGELSNIHRAAKQQSDNAQIKRRQMEVTAESIERQNLEVIAGCVLSWNLHDGETPIPCTKHNIVTVFLAAPWIKKDIEAAMKDSARFLAPRAE